MAETKEIIKHVIEENPVAVKDTLDTILKQKIADNFKQDKGDKK